ncbi:nucleotidyltransferase domain-containing protein [Deltaproteobacteria bacterium TL4]
MIDIQQASRFIAEKQRRLRQQRQVLWQQAQVDFQKIVDCLIERYQPQRIYQWGSLLDSSRFSEISDIDLAIEGIATPETYFKILKDIEELSTFPVDLVRLETLTPERAKDIREKGRLIYDSSDHSH